MEEFKPRMGIEVHAQLDTTTKLFCSCPVAFGEEPNTNVCPICLGLPGVLPVLNKRAVELAMRVAFALNCHLHKESRFARKNYFYPDLPKGYQITQFKFPLATSGSIKVGEEIIRIKRLHLEEEAAKLIHLGDKTFVDYNRAGVPLIEIVTEPDITSAVMAVDYLKKLQKILQFTGASNAVMARGEFRCEPNISVSCEKGKLGTRTEIKNLNSFRAVKRALEYETKRQKKILQEGGTIKQETMRFVEKAGVTRSTRSKEEASDYRYFPEPDLPPLLIEEEWMEKVKRSIPALPEERKKRYIELGLNEEDAIIIANSTKASNFFDETIQQLDEPLEISRWIIREFRAHNEPDISPTSLASLVKMVIQGSISRIIGSEVFSMMVQTGKTPEEIVKEKSLLKISDKEALTSVVKEVFAENPEEFKDFQNGKSKLIRFFIGRVMKKTKGRADPKEVGRIISEYEQKH
ncbi:MAG: Asp-tRNA(Asn)/Glu-tRNA(Gln) amidotransferase subunit GatB [candidate division WOR-3 bacterium]|nr:Asp-tRNA(Asn)/Glu-tRNA(Gln) amidotransferase subunit GatB [candidate division WOR-3 bacterium]